MSYNCALWVLTGALQFPCTQRVNRKKKGQTMHSRMSYTGMSVAVFFLCSSFTSKTLSLADRLPFEGSEGTLRDWTPPQEFLDRFPYYLSGFDYDNRPIWVAELGKWDIRKMVEENVSNIAVMEKYIDQVLFRFNHSLSLRDSTETPVKDGVAIVDMEDYDLMQFASLPTISLMIRKARDVAHAAENMESGYFVNVNAIAQTFIGLVKPLLGHALSRTEIYGTNKERWIPMMLKRLPKTSLPAWYGGDKDFLPVQIHG